MNEDFVELKLCAKKIKDDSCTQMYKERLKIKEAKFKDLWQPKNDWLLSLIITKSIIKFY